MTGTLIAKPIIKDQYWVVTDGEKKVGNVQANNAGFLVNLNGTNSQFSTTNDIKRKVKITFEPLKSNRTKVQMPYPQYPTTAIVYNSVFDVKRKLHLYTKTKKSKCLHAAGWFLLEKEGIKEISFCPKYIFIQRYPYYGPFKTEGEARAFINT